MDFSVWLKVLPRSLERSPSKDKWLLMLYPKWKRNVEMRRDLYQLCDFHEKQRGIQPTVAKGLGDWIMKKLQAQNRAPVLNCQEEVQSCSHLPHLPCNLPCFLADRCGLLHVEKLPWQMLQFYLQRGFCIFPKFQRFQRVTKFLWHRKRVKTQNDAGNFYLFSSSLRWTVWPSALDDVFHEGTLSSPDGVVLSETEQP